MTEPVVSAIGDGWVSAGATGAPNYDEFATDAEVTEAITAAPGSALAIEMPHRTAESVEAGRDFLGSLESAARELASRRADGSYKAASNLVAPYRISGGRDDAETSYGLFCAVSTAEISTSADHPGRVIRNEDVFAEKVVERTALTRRLGTLLSPVLLLQTGSGEELEQVLRKAIDDGSLGEPSSIDTDARGRRHEVWALSTDGSGPRAELAVRLTELAGAGELVVADGNHRSLSAQQAGLERFLAVVTTPGSVRIGAYDRLLHDLGTPVADLLTRLRAKGIDVSPIEGADPAPEPRAAILYADGVAYRLGLGTLAAEADGIADGLDHAVVERVLIGAVLGLAPGDKRVTYVGADYGRSWLTGAVDRGVAEAAVMVAPVSVEDFVRVNLAREKMPRKSTWFTPKARAGLILADVATADAGTTPQATGSMSAGTSESGNGSSLG